MDTLGPALDGFHFSVDDLDSRLLAKQLQRSYQLHIFQVKRMSRRNVRSTPGLPRENLLLRDQRCLQIDIGKTFVAIEAVRPRQPRVPQRASAFWAGAG